MPIAEIDQWLRKGAASIAYPLRRKRLKKRYCDVTLGLEVYRTRFADTFYIEFALYNNQLPRGPHGSKSAPVVTWRLKNVAVIRTGGDHPDLALTGDDPDELEFAKEQIIAQGNELFAKVHSMSLLMHALRGRGSKAIVEETLGPSDGILADKIEAFLEVGASE